MTSSFSETGEGWREKGTKTPFVLTWGALAKIIISFMKVHSKKVVETHQKNGETGVENYFSPLPSLYAPFDKRWAGDGWRRTSSGGILGLLQSEVKQEGGSTFSSSCVSPFIKAASLWPLHNDWSSLSLHGPPQWKDTVGRGAEMKPAPFE